MRQHVSFQDFGLQAIRGRTEMSLHQFAQIDVQDFGLTRVKCVTEADEVVSLEVRAPDCRL